jgi:hypothetical protein
MTKLDIALTGEEIDSFLSDQRTVRLATTGPEGPHAVPLWFVWLEGSMHMNSTLGNLTIVNLTDDSRGAAVVDDGDSYDSLRGVVLHGPVTVGADAVPASRLDAVAAAWSAKYMGGGPLPYDGWRGRVWLRLDPEHVSSWDFRKIPAARVRRDATRGQADA